MARHTEYCPDNQLVKFITHERKDVMLGKRENRMRLVEGNYVRVDHIAIIILVEAVVISVLFIVAMWP